MPDSLHSSPQGLALQTQSQALQDAMLQCIQRRWRLPIWLHASAYAELNPLIAQWQALYQATPSASPLRGFCLGEPPTDSAIEWTPLQGQARQLVLGRECDLLLINGHAGIDWDLVAASMGTVKQGGLWIFCSPAGFPLTCNPQAKKVLSWPTDARSHRGDFQAFIANSFAEQPLVQVYRQEHGVVVLPTQAWQHQVTVHASCDISMTAARHWPTDTVPAVTGDQQQALEAIDRVLTGHRRRPLVLTAHRGRGKSTVLGLAAAAHYAGNHKRVLITAPDPTAAAVALRTAAEFATAAALEFVPVDQLLAAQPRCDLLLVDEAAAIPLPQLQQLNSLYSRVVYATTEHGYEGTGRGFQLRFQQYLQQHNPGWRQLHLQQAIRFAADDPLEQLSFASFLLGPTTTPPSALPTAVSQQWLSRQTLIEQPQLLQQVFALLSLAHYQTRVRDLWALLDDPSLHLAIQQAGEQITGVMVISAEGGFPPELAEAIAQGSRRVQGHLLAQSLAYHLLLPELSHHLWWRIQRIVVEPTLQRHGLGQQFLTWLDHEATTAGRSLGTSFGATTDLVNFWQTQGFVPVRLSAQADQASNEYPLLMLKPNALVPMSLLQTLQHDMGQQLYLNRTQLQKLAPSLLRQWLRPLPQALGEGQQRLLQAFALGQRPLQEVQNLLPVWLDLVFSQLPDDDAEQLICWLWHQERQTSEQLQKLSDLSRKYIQMTYIKF